MLPVRVKVLFSSSPSLSQASSLLQRFLSSDACSDALARDYVANVAQALQDSISWRAGEAGPFLDKDCHFPSPFDKEIFDGKQSISATQKPTLSSAHGKLHIREKQRLHAGEHDNGNPRATPAVDDGNAAGSATEELENAHKRHKKKRRHSAVEENGKLTVSASMQEPDDPHREKKRRKKEDAEQETGHIAIENCTPDQRTRKKEKSKRVIEHIGLEDTSPDKIERRKKEKNDREGRHFENIIPDKERHHEKKKRKDKQEAYIDSIELASPAPGDLRKQKRKRAIEHIGAEDASPDEIKRRKKEKNDREGRHFEDNILHKERHHEKKKRKDQQEAYIDSIELASPAPSDLRKKKRKKEKHGKDAENIETLHVLEFWSPSTPILRDESFLMKSAIKGKKKQDVDTLDADKSGVAVTPLLPIANEKEGSSKRKKKDKAGVLVTPDRNASKDNSVQTAGEALPVQFGNLESVEKRSKKKKRARKEEPEFA